MNQPITAAHRETARLAVSLVLKDDEAAWEPVAQLIANAEGKRAESRARKMIHDAQDMLTAAMNTGDPTGLHSTAHAVRDNLRTALANYF